MKDIVRGPFYTNVHCMALGIGGQESGDKISLCGMRRSETWWWQAKMILCERFWKCNLHRLDDQPGFPI